MSNSSPHKKGVLLVIDDDRSILETLSIHWKDRQPAFDIMFAETAEEGLRILIGNPVEVVLTDQQLPDATGLFLMSEINRRYPLVKVILMTARANEETRAKALSLGAVEFLAKPFDLERLDALLAQIREMDNSGLNGIIRQLSLSDIVQLKCSILARAKFILKGMGEEGVLYFDSGALIYAKCGDCEGEEAFYRMFCWPRGTFEETAYSAAPERNINKNWEGLLLEAAQKKDETGVPADEDFDDVKLATPVTPAAPSDETMTPPGENALANLDTLGLATGVLLCTRSGSLIASTITDRPNQAAAISAFLVQQGHCLGRFIGQKTLRRVYVRSASRQRVVLPRGQSLIGMETSPDIQYWPHEPAVHQAIIS